MGILGGAFERWGCVPIRGPAIVQSVRPRCRECHWLPSAVIIIPDISALSVYSGQEILKDFPVHTSTINCTNGAGNCVH